MREKSENKGLFIGFIGVPGVGKSSVASALAKMINAKAFIEPGEESHPIKYDQERWQDKVALLEQWVCETNLKNFQEARLLANSGEITIADAGIFLVNKELIYAPSFSWWYGLISQEEKDKIYQTALSDWINAPCPDVLVLFETDTKTWQQYLLQRGRNTDDDETCLSTYLEQQAVMAQAANQFANARGISFIKFNNEYGSPERSAHLLYDTLFPLFLKTPNVVLSKCSENERERDFSNKTAHEVTLEQESPSKHDNEPSSPSRIYNALRNSSKRLDPFTEIKTGFSYQGEKINRPLQRIEYNLPPGHKQMTVWDEQLETFCLAVVPEDTPELTDEEYEKYNSINPM